jgi:hypothetical protein
MHDNSRGTLEKAIQISNIDRDISNANESNIADYSAIIDGDVTYAMNLNL